VSEWTPLALVRWTTDYFQKHGLPTPRLDAELLLAHVLGGRRIDLYLGFEAPVGESERGRYRDLVRRRADDRVPVAYLTGEREFWSCTLQVEPEVLVPRPETECVVEAVVALGPTRVVDVGTGSGAIGCAVALECPEATVVAIDRSPVAVRVARANAERLGLGDRVRFLVGDLLSPVAGRWDVVVANLPYVPTASLSTLPPEVRHEPKMALDGGPDGLDVVRELVRHAPGALSHAGAVVLEVGEGQASEVERLLREAGAPDTAVRKDLAGIERVVIARFEGN
jgi:release factor glutamine methyltransferase